jgi:hypothetical protein
MAILAEAGAFLFPRIPRAVARCTRRRILVLIVSLVALVPIRNANSQANPTELKAVFLFNFAQFVEWPASGFASTNSPLVIGVLGTDPFGKVLDDVLRNERARNRRLTLERYKRLSDIERCHILYISKSEQAHMDEILAAFRGKPVLTVAETDDFAREGGIIQLITDRKVRLRINHKAAKASGLSISAKMLQLAEVIN